MLATLALAAPFFPPGAAAETTEAASFFEGRVVGIVDGDTLDVLVEGAPRRIRIAAIDTPERGQPWAERAKQALAARVSGKEVRVNALATDVYGRTVGEVYADGVCVGCELVRSGHAWVYRKYSDDPVLLELEAEARRERRGLWSLPEAERAPPWEWRHAAGRAPARSAPLTIECGAKSRCREMTSCEEARLHLELCGGEALDGDGDGEPCEALCGTR